MAVEKSIDLTATGATLDEAIGSAIHRASLTLKGLTSFQVEKIEGTIEHGEPVYKVLVRIWFVIKEKMHE
jgi:flavin-binding protein dodecin